MAYLGPSLRREKRKERPVRRLAAAVTASLALNVLALWALAGAGAFRLSGTKPDPARVALAPMSAAQWEANRKVAPRRDAPPPPEEEHPTGTVVQLPPEEPEQAPETPADGRDEKRRSKPKFLSDRDRRVRKETVSRFAGEYPNLAPEPQRPQRDRRGSGEEGRSRDVDEGREGTRGDPLAFAPAPDGEMKRGDGGEDGRRAQGKRVPNLAVGPDVAERALAGPNMDGVREGIEQGDGTYLNTAKFKYAGYINRMGNAIGDDWRPRVRSAIADRDPDGSAFLYKERTVVLGITLDPSGRVTDLSVLESSNVNFIDRVAIAAVRAAQPFPNPPRGLFERDDATSIAFSFTIYPGDRRGFLFWRPPHQ